MFGLPDFIKILTKGDYPFEDQIDKLNSYVTVYALAFFAVITTAKQNFGSPIQCMAPPESTGSWVQYYHDYCYIQNKIKLPNSVTVPGYVNGMDQNWATSVVYYQWVPFIFVLQAFFFLVPRMFWSFASAYLCIGHDVFCLINETKKIRNKCGEDRTKGMKSLADFISDTLRFRGKRKTGGFSMTLCYIFRKWLMFFNVIVQFIWLTYIFSPNSYFVGDFQWGYEMLKSSFNKTARSPVDGFFPTLVRCDVVRLDPNGNQNRISMQCVLMMNFINEKIFLLIYLWLIFLAVLNLISAFWYSSFIFPRRRKILAATILPPQEDLVKKAAAVIGVETANVQGHSMLDYFLSEVLKWDGLLMLLIIYNRFGGMVTFEISHQLWNIAVQPSFKLGDSVEPVEEDKKADHPPKPKFPPRRLLFSGKGFNLREPAGFDENANRIVSAPLLELDDIPAKNLEKQDAIDVNEEKLHELKGADEEVNNETPGSYPNIYPGNELHKRGSRHSSTEDDPLNAVVVENNRMKG